MSLRLTYVVLQSMMLRLCFAGATDIITANTEVATEMGSQLLQYLGANQNGVRILVRELRKQMDNHVIELADELAADTSHMPKDPDGYVYKVDQKLLSSAVSSIPKLVIIPGDRAGSPASLAALLSSMGDLSCVARSQHASHQAAQIAGVLVL